MEIGCAILSIGTELTTGKILETNSHYLSQKLLRLGIQINTIKKIPDDFSVFKREFLADYKFNDLIIIAGGLGPTLDDITKDVIKEALKLEYRYSQEIEQEIRRYFQQRNIPMPELNKVQAQVFKNSLIMKNKIGTAPGYIIEKNNKVVVLLPGPPYEMEPMFQQYVIPYLKRKWKIKFYEKIIRLFGISESYVGEKLIQEDKVIKQLKGDITYLSTPNLIDIIITTRFNFKQIKKRANKIKFLFKNNMYTDQWESIYEVVARLLIKNRLTLSVAESCTGGLVSKTLTDIPGSSNFLLFDVVVYSNLSKVKLLKVPQKILKQFGAVSAETAQSMIQGLEKIIKTDISVSVTGIAGPTGGSKKKPLGTVFIGIKYRGKMIVQKYNFLGSREKIRLHTLNKIMENIYTAMRPTQRGSDNAM